MRYMPAAGADSTHCYLHPMKQVITHMPEALHALAKDEAARRGQSLNDFVIAAITAALGDDENPPFRARAAALGLLANPAGPRWTDEDEARYRAWLAEQPPGFADAVVEALLEERRTSPW